MSTDDTNWHDVHDVMNGAVARVLSVRDDRQQLHIQYPNGGIGRYHTAGPVSYDVGDIVLVNEDRIELGPPELWKVVESVAVVREVIGNDVLLEVDGHLRTTTLPTDVDIEANSTVMFSEADGISRVLASRAIRPKLIDRDEDYDLSPFRVTPGNETATFDDFGGYPDIVRQARTLIETQLNKADNLKAIRARPIRGVLFAGPSGTGKTMLARIIAKISNAEFFLVGGPSIVTKWVGDSEQLLRLIFQKATEAERAIIFFDEIDSVASQRTEESHESSNRLVAQLLSLMDGFSESPGNVVVIAATNRPQDIDQALRRPGRFDWTIHFGYPDLSDRLSILQVSGRKVSTRGVLPFRQLASATEGWSAAEVTALWSEAAIAAAADDRQFVDEEDLMLAFARVESRRAQEPGGLDA